MTGRAASLLEDAAVILVLLLSLALLCPGALTDPHRGLGQFDASFTQIATEHLQDVLLHGADWRDAPLGWPLGYGTANADWQAGQAILGLPLRLLDMDPSRAALLLGLFGLFATGFAGHRLARALLGPGPHTALAAVLLGPGALPLSHLHHVNLIHHELMLVGVLALGAGLERDRPRLAALGGAAIVGGFHLGVYVGLHGLLAGAVVAAAAALARLGSARSWRAAALGAGLVALTVWPVLSYYADAADWAGARLDQDELVLGGWDASTLISPNPGARLHTLLWGPATGIIAKNPGFGALGLAVVGLWALRGARPRWAWGAVLGVAAFSLLLALGTELRWRGERLGVPGPYALVSELAGLDLLREPDRFCMTLFMATGLLAAAGLRHLMERSPAWARWPLVGVALLLALGEAPVQGSTALDHAPVPQVYLALFQLPGEGAVWERPHTADAPACACASATQVRAALLDRRPLVGRSFARKTTDGRELAGQMAWWPAPGAAELIERLGVVAVVEHPPVETETPEGWICQVFGQHRLCATTRDVPWTGAGRVPPYTGLSSRASWTPALPVRDRDPSRFLPVGPLLP